MEKFLNPCLCGFKQGCHSRQIACGIFSYFQTVFHTVNHDINLGYLINFKYWSPQKVDIKSNYPYPFN